MCLRTAVRLLLPLLLVTIAGLRAQPLEAHRGPGASWTQFIYRLPATVQAYLLQNFGIDRQTLKASRFKPAPHSELPPEGLRQRNLSPMVLPDGYSSTSSGARLIFAHVADGQIPGSGQFYRTTFTLAGNPIYSVHGWLEFFQDNGDPLALTVNGVTASSFSFDLAMGASLRLSTAGSGSQKVGWARILADQPLSCAAAFSVTDAQGTIYADVGIGESPANTFFTLFADSRGPSDTGVALVNPSESESRSVRLELFRADGVSMGVETLILPPRGHRARFLTELFARVSGIQEFEGSLQVSSTGAIAGITLRITGDQLTSLPMYQRPVSTSTLFLPQIAKGTSTEAGIRYATTLVLINNGTEASGGNFAFFDSSGQPLTVTLGGAANSTFSFNIPANGVARYTTDFAGSIRTGWARVYFNDSKKTCGVAVIFHVQNLSGELLTEVGVPGLQMGTSHELLADSLGAFDTGLAVANTDESRNAAIQLTLLDAQGNQRAQACMALGPLQHQAIFLTQLFPQVGGIEEFQGRLRITSPRQIAVLSLRSIAEKLTSVPGVRSQLGFSPVSIFEPLSRVGGSSPPVRWRVRLNGFDLGISSIRFSAPQMGLNLSALQGGAPMAAGYIYIDNLAGLTQGQILSGSDLLMPKARAADGVGFSLQQFQGKINGNPSNGLTIELTPTNPLLGGSNYFFSDMEVDFYFAGGIITLPAGMRSTEVLTDFTSAPTQAEESESRVLAQVRQQIQLNAEDAVKGLITDTSPALTTPGAFWNVKGRRFGSSPRMIFYAADGASSAAELFDNGDGTWVVEVPPLPFKTAEARIDNGSGVGESLRIPSLFAPSFDLYTATHVGGATTPFSLLASQGERELAAHGMEVLLRNVDADMVGLAVGSLVGTSWRSGSLVRQGTVMPMELKVASATADSVVLDVYPVGDDEPAGQITLQKQIGPPPGLRIEVKMTASEMYRANYFPGTWAVNFTLPRLRLPPSGQRVNASAAVFAVPFGILPSGLQVASSSSFRTEAGVATYPTTSTIPYVVTTTTFPCSATPTPTTSTTVRPTTTTQRVTTTSTTVRVTTTSTTVRPTTTTVRVTSTSTTVRPTTTTVRATTTSTTVRPTTTTAQVTTTSTTVRPTTTTTQIVTTTSTSSTTVRVTTTTQRVTTTTLPGGPCNLFSDDFNRGNFSGWSVVPGTPGNWMVVNGWLSVLDLLPDDTALLSRSGLPVPNYFQLNVDIRSEEFTGPYHGFLPYSSRQVFTVGGILTNGIGAAMNSAGQVGFLFNDLNRETYTLLDAMLYDSIQSVGIQYSANGVTLLVNRVARRVLQNSFSADLSMDNLLLVGTGGGNLRFDNVCQSSQLQLQPERGDLPRSSLQITSRPVSLELSRQARGAPR